MTYSDFQDRDETISLQEWKTLVSLVVSTVVYIGYGLIAWNRFQAETLDARGVLLFGSRAILILIGLYILFTILGYIALAIATVILTGEEDEAMDMEDERDKRFELLSTRNSSAVFGIGFLLSMIALAIGQPPEAFFVIMYLAMLIGAVVGDVTKLRLYRRGY